ncbi:MAG: rod shape-determining protein MreC [Proteobacteria bacterium]|nr:rod shape-determining protein MreC [Pseudomonadota bacterium]
MRRRLIDWSLTGLLVLIPALVLRSSLSRGTPSGFDQALLRITAPLEAGVSWVVEGLGGLWSGYVALVSVERENTELRAENETLRKQLATMTRRAYDVAALEDLATVKKRTPADTLGARVIGAPLSPQFRVLRIRIDRGEREIQYNMPVITSAGAVGTIGTVYGDYADVKLISDPGSKIDVVVSRTGNRGTLVGLGRPDSYACKIDALEHQTAPEAKAQLGDEIVTSGKNGPFPPGIAIGKIGKLSGDNGLFQEVEVDPAVDVSRAGAVMVLLAPPPPPDPDGKIKKKSDPAFGGKPQ